MSAPTVSEALRRFLPEHLSTQPLLSAPQRRAIWAMQACRTPALGGRAYGCAKCSQHHFAYHSCNHKACPQCGREATRRWVAREQRKLIAAPYFMVTFTLPSELRGLFFGSEAKSAYDVFFTAASRALSEKLAASKWLGATENGFTMVLHTWNQKMLFHPHLHCIVPGAGLDAKGQYRSVKSAQFLVPVPVLSKAFRAGFRAQMEQRGWQCDPAVWRMEWGVHVQACGSGGNIVKYLGTYVARSVIADSRIVSISDNHVTIRYQDREEGGAVRTLQLEGKEFVKRYLRHVLPRKLRSVRYYGWCHPAAKKDTAQSHRAERQAHRVGSRTRADENVPAHHKVSLLRAAHGTARHVQADVPRSHATPRSAATRQSMSTPTTHQQVRQSDANSVAQSPRVRAAQESPIASKRATKPDRRQHRRDGREHPTPEKATQSWKHRVKSTPEIHRRTDQ